MIDISATAAHEPTDPVGVQANVPAPREQLSTRIIAVSLAALILVLGMIFSTLLLSWKLEGAGAAINDAGSLRMRANRMAIELVATRSGRPNGLQEQMTQFEDTLARLRDGNPARPLFLPDEPSLRGQLDRVAHQWHDTVRPALMDDARRPYDDSGTYLAMLPGFVGEADKLVRMIEQDNTQKTALLRLSQILLALLACIGTAAMIHLLYLWIIRPVRSLQDGLNRMAERDFTVRLPVETRDEFGQLVLGFNRMAGELQGLYADLERRVEDKTAELAARNHALASLYDMTTFLSEPHDVETMCRGFLQRVMAQFDANGGSLRILNPSEDKLHLVVSEGFPPTWPATEHCMTVDACLCGAPVRLGTPLVRDLQATTTQTDQGRYPCLRLGLAGLWVFRIGARHDAEGSFSLHFRTPRGLSPAESDLLETLGHHLGVAINHQRLSASARQLAVVEERNLVAQGLHDSIAQALNYLNLQIQMLADAIATGNLHDVHAIVPRLRRGVEESYQDVRELLANFRTKLGHGNLRLAIEDTIERFQRQSSVKATLRFTDDGGTPMALEQQLQVLFILQEALSNVRKHAMASQVIVDVRDGPDFTLAIEDNGRGYDPAIVFAGDQLHVGLSIMLERADRLHARLQLHGVLERGASVRLTLPENNRQPA
ncbi:type IV pili methyl-accepting chemotaxis transducer N-terminal domain-containing protein [Dyella amyloliquefaciens]|uniref:type IV pili methyl-accepting chemotaxis transducer N-terminal domain-containing protein n=1 Tax=Dyella amyloliquefaciens TaxID=1770545 RepID=UPI00197AE870|nr:type IV pili methyl-accepting chemotaxis transducer N-terminal domain-containing protein [Dyella amyloliquefaciens]